MLLSYAWRWVSVYLERSREVSEDLTLLAAVVHRVPGGGCQPVPHSLPRMGIRALHSFLQLATSGFGVRLWKGSWGSHGLWRLKQALLRVF